jgi:hypothetical protein
MSKNFEKYEHGNKTAEISDTVNLFGEKMKTW